MKIEYNRITKSFSIKPVLLDQKNWKRSYLSMLRESDEQCILMAKSKSKDYAKSESIELLLSKNVEIQYFIYSEIAKESTWINQYIPRYNKELRSFAVDMGKSAVSQLNKIFDELKVQLVPDEFFELKEYRVGNHKTYKYKLDNFNRVVIKPIPEYNQVRIIGLMFHYDDSFTDNEKFPTELKQILMDMYNDLKKNSGLNPTALTDKYN